MSRQIVVVDDESDILAIVSEVLLSDGYTPRTFVSSTQALTYILATPPALVITDLLMPILSGQELVKRARERYGNMLPIVVMSASVNLASVATLPIQAFLSKPFDLDEISELMQQLLESR